MKAMKMILVAFVISLLVVSVNGLQTASRLAQQRHCSRGPWKYQRIRCRFRQGRRTV